MFERLAGPEVPQDWVGGIKGVNYTFGPGYTDGSKVVVEVNNRLENRTINNVIGVIKGCQEPDRFVLVGNHRDSWTFGSVDPSSGTAAMLEMSTAFVKVMKSENWCPRRSIVFCSWGAEEYGLIGSSEWVQQNQKMLQSQAVAYLNVDIAVQGNFSLRANGIPSLFKATWDAAKVVENPDPQEVSAGRKMVYDTWLKNIPGSIISSYPNIGQPGSGSDHSPFLQIAGVPVIDFRYTCNDTLVKCYPLYHTMYETYFLQSNILDKGFQV